MKIPHPKFCVLPWVSLETSPIGTVRPCCLAKNEIVDDAGAKLFLGETSLDVIRNTPYMRSLRRAFLVGEPPADCERCWSEERAGRTSKRMHTLERLKHMIEDKEWTEHAEPLQFLDLKLGNICNLKCRICGSWSSSTYASEEIRHQPDKKNNYHYVMMKLGRWPREETRFWSDLEKHMSGIRYLEFTGGEPFMIQEHFDLLRKLVTAGHAGQIEIHYNTNGTVFPAGAEDIWRHFRHVEVAFSIDDVAERFEYQRSGATWLGVNANLELFREMRARNNNMTLQVCTTVNAFNVMYLPDVAAWIDQQDFNFVYWNILHDARQFCIACLPTAAKQEATTRLKSAEFSSDHSREIERIIEFMWQGTQDLSQDLCASIRQVDQRRAQDIRRVAPDFARAIGYDTV